PSGSFRFKYLLKITLESSRFILIKWIASVLARTTFAIIPRLLLVILSQHCIPMKWDTERTGVQQIAKAQLLSLLNKRLRHDCELQKPPRHASQSRWSVPAVIILVSFSGLIQT